MNFVFVLLLKDGVSNGQVVLRTQRKKSDDIDVSSPNTIVPGLSIPGFLLPTLALK